MCKYHKRIIEIGKQLSQSMNNFSSRKCSICKCPGHYSKKCLAIKVLIDEITAQNSIESNQISSQNDDDFFEDENSSQEEDDDSESENNFQDDYDGSEGEKLSNDYDYDDFLK